MRGESYDSHLSVCPAYFDDILELDHLLLECVVEHLQAGLGAGVKHLGHRHVHGGRECIIGTLKQQQIPALQWYTALNKKIWGFNVSFSVK